MSAVTAPPSAPTAQTTSRRKHLSDRARAERRLAYWLIAPAAIVMVAVTAYPIIDAVALSLQRADLRFPNATKFIGLSNYGHVLTAPVWWQDVFHTVILTVISVSIQLVLGMCLALNRHLRNPGTVIRNPVDQLMTSCPELLRPHIASSLPHSHISQIPEKPRRGLPEQVIDTFLSLHR